MLGMGRKKPRVGSHGDKESNKPALDPARLVELMQCFQIGNKIRYFPVGQEHLAMDSIVIAYGINDHLVYTQNDIRSHIEGRDQVFLIDDSWRDLVVRKVHSFCLLIPHIIDDENDMSYPRKVELLNETRFVRGQELTLISLLNTQGLPHLNTRVRKRVVMDGGYYANHPVVVLETQPETLSMLDQRLESRVHTNIPAQLTVFGGEESCSCALVDFSESYIRVRGDKDSTVFKLLYENQTLNLTVDLGQQHKHLAVQGKVMRRDDEYLVMTLEQIEKDDEWRPFSMIDIFEFKAILLQHPETR